LSRFKRGALVAKRHPPPHLAHALQAKKPQLIDHELHAGNQIMPPFVASRDRNLTQASKSTEVMVRFGLRMAAIAAFAVFGGIGFQRGLTVMLWMSAILGAVIAMFDREEPLSSALNHWDEAMAYAALCCLACTFEHPM
jgi:hypothetical protein